MLRPINWTCHCTCPTEAPTFVPVIIEVQVQAQTMQDAQLLAANRVKNLGYQTPTEVRAVATSTLPGGPREPPTTNLPVPILREETFNARNDDSKSAESEEVYDLFKDPKIFGGAHSAPVYGRRISSDTCP